MTKDEAMTLGAYLEASNRVLYGERVMVVRDESVTKIGSIILPNEQREKYGVVIMIGLGIDEEHRMLGGLSVGDKVLFNKYNTLELTVHDKDGGEHEAEVFHAADIYMGWRE